MEYIYGYARGSTQEQKLDRQLDIIKKAYVGHEIIGEKTSRRKI